MDVDGNTTTIILHHDRSIRVHRDRDMFRMTCHRFIDRVIDDFPDEVMESLFIRFSDIHPGTFANGFEAFEDLDLTGVVGHTIEFLGFKIEIWGWDNHKKESNRIPNIIFAKHDIKNLWKVKSDQRIYKHCIVPLKSDQLKKLRDDILKSKTDHKSRLKFLLKFIILSYDLLMPFS